MLNPPSSVYPPLTTPSINTPELHAFARQIKRDGELAQIKVSKRRLRLGNCYWNVAHVAKESGRLHSDRMAVLRVEGPLSRSHASCRLADA